ncbi:MAG: hypothetical protein AAF681_05795 [Pseudomonadota bacterium]
MKKTKRKSKRKVAPEVSTVQHGSKPAQVSRRALINKLSWFGLAAGLGGGAIFFGARSVTARMAEADLGRIGQGIPAVVQVHDPTCPLCAALQKQARRAMRSFEEDELVFLVADQTTPNGRAFAQQFGATHVTLILLDGQGEYVQTLQGVRPESQLAPFFAELAK